MALKLPIVGFSWGKDNHLFNICQTFGLLFVEAPMMVATFLVMFHILPSFRDRL